MYSLKKQQEQLNNAIKYLMDKRDDQGLPIQLTPLDHLSIRILIAVLYSVAGKDLCSVISYQDMDDCDLYDVWRNILSNNNRFMRIYAKP